MRIYAYSVIAVRQSHSNPQVEEILGVVRAQSPYEAKGTALMAALEKMPHPSYADHTPTVSDVTDTVVAWVWAMESQS